MRGETKTYDVPFHFMPSDMSFREKKESKRMADVGRATGVRTDIPVRSAAGMHEDLSGAGNGTFLWGILGWGWIYWILP